MVLRFITLHQHQLGYGIVTRQYLRFWAEHTDTTIWLTIKGLPVCAASSQHLTGGRDWFIMNRINSSSNRISFYNKINEYSAV